VRNILTTNKVLEIVDLYLDLDSCRPNQVIADLAGVSVSLVQKLLVHRPPYDYSELIPAEKLERMAEVRQKKRRWVHSKIDLPTARQIKRIVRQGNFGTVADLARRFGVERHTIYRAMRRLEC
jgi:hypothetical protein